jgi:hypothetical protein
MKHANSMRGLANPNSGVGTFLINFRVHMNTLFIIRVKILVVIKFA